MRDGFIDISQGGALKFVMGALALYIVLKLTRKALNAYPGKSPSSHRMLRFFPMVEIFIWLLFLLWGAGRVFQAEAASLLAQLILALAVVTWIANVVFRDWIAGVIFKAEAKYQVGDLITLQGNHGQLKQLGYRTLMLENSTGTLVEIPYSHLTKQSHVEKSPRHNTGVTFQVGVPGAGVLEEVLPRIRSAVLCAPWCSLARQPQIRFAGAHDGRLWVEVSAYVIDDRYAHYIEVYVKQRFSDNAKNDSA